MKQFIFSIICSLLLIGCGGKSVNSSSNLAVGLPCDTAWAVTRGESKQSVYVFMESQDLTITDEDSILIGFKVGGVYWCGDKWDMATVKFNTQKRAIGVNLMRGEPLGEYMSIEVAKFLETRYGTSEYNPELAIWTFRGNDNTSAFMAQYPRAMIDVAWSIFE